MNSLFSKKIPTVKKQRRLGRRWLIKIVIYLF
jgi:hypothetical protein